MASTELCEKLGLLEQFLIRGNTVKALKKEGDWYGVGTTKRPVWLEQLNNRGIGRREDGEVRGSRIMWAIMGILNLSKNKLLSSCRILSKGRV